MKAKFSSKDEFDKIFFPRSVAIVGASENILKAGTRFLKPFLKMGFKGDIYAINPNAESAFNCQGYSKITDVPGHIDHVVVCVPSMHIPSIIQQCVDKSVNSVVIFSSGFSESGTEDGRLLEEEIVRLSRDSHLRIIGPNCMGVYCPSGGVSFRDDLPERGGPVALISQSGGVAITTVLTANERNLYFSKVISYGNECDLRSSEVIEYLSDDDETSIIMQYIEGTKDGSEFLSALKKASLKKPVVLLKGGVTDAGTRAVTSHTGALSGMAETWSAVIQQSGAIQTYSVEEFVDTTLAFNLIKPPQGRNLGVVSVSGGLGVNLSDLAIRMGFNMPEFSADVKKQLGRFINAPGTGVHNPVDMAVTFFGTENFKHVYNQLERDDSVDIILMHLCMEYIVRFKEIIPNLDELIVSAIAEGLLALKKPFVMILPHTIQDDKRKKVENQLLEQKIPTYPTIERALISINHCMSYYEMRDKR